MIREFFEVKLDLRALACLRICLGSLVLLDLLLRCRDLTAFYTDQGALPRTTLLQIPHPTFLNFYLAAGTSFGVIALCLLTGLAAAGLTLGWNTRWCTLLTWVLHMALKHRNPLILHVGDLELGLVLFWAIFLPLGARYSLDARVNPKWADLPNTYSSVATFGYLLQLSVLYFMAGLYKLDPIWTDSKLALYYCLSYDQFATEWGRGLVQHLDLLKPLSLLTVVVELGVGILFWMPWKRRVFQGAACVVLVLLHLGIAATLNLGIIVPISILVTTGLWPGRLFSSIKCGKSTEIRGIQKRAEPSNYILAPWARFLAIAVCCHLLIYNLAVYQRIILPKPIKYFGYLTRQQQTWQMFAPHPGVQDGWFVAQGETLGGRQIDLLRDGAPVSLDKPESVSASFPNHRWRCWLLNLGNRRDARVNTSFATWLANDWNTRHPGPQSVKRVTLIFVSEPTPLPEQNLVTNPVILHEFECPESLYKKPHQVFLPLTPPGVEPSP